MANYYVDFSAVNDGDGTAYGQAAAPGGVGAWNTLVGHAVGAGGYVWIRRVAKAMTTTALTLTAAQAYYIGWPVSGDIYYAARPDGGAWAAWDGDAATYAEINWTTGAGMTVPALANTSELYRLKLKITTTGTICLTLTGGVVAYNCWIENAGSSTSYGMCLYHSGTYYSKFDNCTIKQTGAGAGGAVIYTAAATFNLAYINCTVLSTSPNLGTQLCYWTNAGTVYCIGCTFYTQFCPVAVPNVIFTNNVANILFMNDCVVDTDSVGSSISIIIGSGAATTAARLIAYNLTINRCRTIQISGASFVHFKKFAQTTLGAAPPTYAIQVFDPGTIICGSNFSFIPGNISGDIQVAPGVYYFLQNCIFANPVSPAGASPANWPGIWLMDEGGAVGNFRFYGQKGEMTSSGVVRSGGESFSFRFDMAGQYDSGYCWKQLAPMLGGMETIWVTLPASASTITLYGAYKGYGSNPPTAKDLWFELDYQAGATTERTTSSTRSATPDALSADASSWSGDTVTGFKLVIAVTPGTAGKCPIRLFHCKNVVNGIVYLDPKPVIT